jgi:hypothetical protein
LDVTAKNPEYIGLTLTLLHLGHFIFFVSFSLIPIIKEKVSLHFWQLKSYTGIKPPQR